MVRVGGGWDTLEHYLERHDPCRVYRVVDGQCRRIMSADVEKLRRGSVMVDTPANRAKSANPGFLVFGSRYKSS